MKLRLSLQGRILLGLAILAVVLLSVLWILVRPKYETSVVSERITIVQQLQSYVIENLDKQISEWVSASRSIAWEIAEHPRDGESLLRSTISLFPEIVQIKIQSPELPDELTSQNTAYPVPAVQPAEHQFVPSADSIVQLAWLTAVPGTPSTMMVMRTRFQVSGRMFMMSVIWDAKSLQHYIERLPLGTDYYLRIYSKSFVVFENRPEKAFTDSVHTQQHMNDLRKVKSAGGEWRVITGTFRSTDLTMLVAVPEGAILEPVHQLLVYSSTFIVGFLLVLLLLGWMLSYQISRPVALLVKDVERLGNLDFQQTIRIPEMRNLRKMGETIEGMRRSLERYQRLNVEKIILEEWKNKLFMNHSDDLIGFTDGNHAFVFRNAKFDELCQTLSPSHALTTKNEVLHHSAVTKIKETSQREEAGQLTTEMVQSELKIQLEAERMEYYRVNDLSIFREGENLGSLIIFHDLTNDRMIDKMKTEMMNIVVHELRNPVSSIMGFSDILLNDTTVTDIESREFMTHIMNSSQKLNALINRFLDISRLESRRIEYPKKLIDCAACVREAVKSQQPQLAHKSLMAEIDIAEDIPEIVVAPDLFREAVLNLLSNAIKYGDSHRTIAIKLMRTGSDVVFSITDHGYGIPPEAQEKLFSKFYRVPDAKSIKEVGTGLGLAYVKEIAEYHHGSITLESNAEIGSRFTLSIPIVTDETAAVS